MPCLQGPYLNGSGSGVVNDSSYKWAITNLPLFDASDADIVSAYYYRAKTYRSHLIQTDWADIKHVVSEFGPSVPWGGVYGSINAAAGHHLSEGRWLRDPEYMDGLTRFWIGSQVGGGPTGSPSGGAGSFEPGVGHFANGTRGASGGCPYSSWILTGAVKRLAVKGDLDLGTDIRGDVVRFADLLPMMVEWWESRSLQLRVDCVVANNGSSEGPDKTCLDLPPSELTPYCYIMADGWDAMEGSVSGGGCRPTIGAMMWSEARAIATVANATGNATLAAQFDRRASWIQQWYLEHLWSEEAQWLTVFKEGRTFHGPGGCSGNTLKNQSEWGERDPNLRARKHISLRHIRKAAARVCTLWLMWVPIARVAVTTAAASRRCQSRPACIPTFLSAPQRRRPHPLQAIVRSAPPPRPRQAGRSTRALGSVASRSRSVSCSVSDPPTTLGSPHTIQAGRNMMACGRHCSTPQMASGLSGGQRLLSGAPRASTSLQTQRHAAGQAQAGHTKRRVC